MDGRHLFFRGRYWLTPVSLVILGLATSLWSTAFCRPTGEPDPARYQTSGRDSWQLPDTVLAALKIKKGQVVADIGAAGGYFARRFSRVVGPSGRVLAVDIDIQALSHLALLAAEDGLTNLDTVHASSDDPRLNPNSAHLVFFCNTLHHIGNRADYLKRLKRVLKPGGRVAVVDFFKRDLPVGPRSLSHKLGRAEAIETFHEAGYRIVEEYDFLPYQYFFVASVRAIQ